MLTFVQLREGCEDDMRYFAEQSDHTEVSAAARTPAWRINSIQLLSTGIHGVDIHFRRFWWAFVLLLRDFEGRLQQGNDIHDCDT